MKIHSVRYAKTAKALTRISDRDPKRGEYRVALDGNAATFSRGDAGRKLLIYYVAEHIA